MRREFHVRFCEGPRVQFPRATRRNVYVQSATVVRELATYLRGWMQYFRICQVPRPRRILDK